MRKLLLLALNSTSEVNLKGINVFHNDQFTMRSFWGRSLQLIGYCRWEFSRLHWPWSLRWNQRSSCCSQRKVTHDERNAIDLKLYSLWAYSNLIHPLPLTSEAKFKVPVFVAKTYSWLVVYDWSLTLQHSEHDSFMRFLAAGSQKLKGGNTIL